VVILVTGAAGFLGSHVVDHLLTQGHRVVGLDSFDDFYPRSVKEANLLKARASDRFELVETDIRDRDGLNCLPDDIQQVIHLAARAGVRPSIESPDRYASVNIEGTWSLLEWARRQSIKLFIAASSSSVYGNSSRVPFREDHFVGAPISPYAATKRAMELACHTHVHLYGMSIIALRLFTVYGPRQRPDLAIHKFARLLRDGQPLPVFGDGTTARDYTYIDDILQGIEGAQRLLESSPEPRFEIINLGESRTVTLSAMIEILSEEMGVRAQIDQLPAQPGDVRQTYADVTKAQELLGYDPRWAFRDGVRAFLTWLENTSEGL